ncbi:hypothetical protein [Celeribacter naphthalenivorans]|uniref:hypothetical protein n=1 Tax=Celeribacter naphthalenivorans TaxID=1614694 RepID=UPI001CF99CD1|nr:hypothetical protein [Celeribacter naphthalenivorans]
MSIEMATTITFGYGLVLFLAAIGLMVAQLAGYWRWQDSVAAEGGWPRALAIMFTLLLPLVASIGLIIST